MNYARSLVGTSLSIGVLAVACSLGPPRTAADVLARAVRAHGGDKLTRWQTLTLTGTVEMSDGVTYNAAYSVLAKLPDRLRVEQDLTADRGRAFYEYYLNGGVAWSRRNLVPARADPARLQRWLNQCFGVAYYAKHAKKMSLKPDGAVEWLIRDGSSESSWKGVDTVPAYVVEITTAEGATVELSFDSPDFSASSFILLSHWAFSPPLSEKGEKDHLIRSLMYSSITLNISIIFSTSALTRFTSSRIRLAFFRSNSRADRTVKEERSSE